MGTTSKNSGGDHDGVVWVLWGLMSLSHARHNKVTPQVETLKIMTIQETKHTANILKILIYNLERGLFLLKRGGDRLVSCSNFLMFVRNFVTLAGLAPLGSVGSAEPWSPPIAEAMRTPSTQDCAKGH